MSRRAAAGSRRNKKHRYVGTQYTDERLYPGYPQPDWRMKPDHQARVVRLAAPAPDQAWAGPAKRDQSLIDRLNGAFKWRRSR